MSILGAFVRTGSDRKKTYYGWTIVFLGALGVFLSGPGQTYSVSTFIDPLMEEFGWSRSLVSGLYSSGTLAAGFIVMFIGRAVDRVGYRLSMTVVALLFAGALFFMSSVGVPFTLLVGFMLIRTLGQGSLTLIPYSLVPQWFVRHRGKSLSVLAMAAAISSATVPYLNLVIMGSFGWRGAWQFWAIVLGLVLAPLAWIFTRDRPEDMALLPDGDSDADVLSSDSGSNTSVPVEITWSLSQALRYAPFWIILISTAIPSMVGTGAQFHHMSILAEGGVGRATDAAVFTVAAAAHLVTTPIFGVLSDRWEEKHLLISGMLLQALALVYLLYVSSPVSAVILGVINGVRMANNSMVNAVIWPAYFGRRHLASIRGVTTTGMVIGSALGPLPFGLGFDVFGGYREVLLLMTVLPLMGAVAGWFLPPPRRIEDPGTKNDG